ncbi:4'-phosphopantetheinyl transferase [Marinobacter lipolyticus SM19]|uniref:4'-phosphopantetheinyl transferase n=1 Tax=Marinobacter lipolyticus SM19 TaxID=1318628 RepID=R8B0V9_9GAMM|nr:4'-phosphopantetheinyl transferase superfamily protein [Marinobacter lipolyticus]EON92192.1 4'-phosphopantetheinyl transferase [Marinobacter lipolyticus SM19]
MAGTSSGCNPDMAPSVWLCPEPEASALPCPRWLTEYERTTVAKFSGPRQREYLSSRWLIRQAIGHGSKCPARECEPVSGRPVASVRPKGWHLSLSHSGGISGCAVSDQPGIGLDLEPLNRHPHWQKVVRRWFTRTEQDWLLANDSHEDFLRVWTLKEAWLKATGRGIAGNLQTLEVRPDFSLYGDRHDSGWQAASGELEGFLVTLVYQRDHILLPSGGLLAGPTADLDLDRVVPTESPLPFSWHRPIEPGN